MTSVEIHSEKQKKKPNAIFVSAGDRETFATLALDTMADDFDVLIFSYGKSIEKHQKYLAQSTVFASGVGSKFNALKAMYDQRSDLIMRYDTIWICDDDIIPEFGDVRVLPAAANLFELKILSPSHSRKGKISKVVMLPRVGRHFLRYTTYVENTCPLFTTRALAEFFKVFDGSLTAYGDDWWYLQTLGADHSPVAGVADGVTIINPFDRDKPGGFGELEQVELVATQRERWNANRRRLGLKDEWTPRILEYVTPSVVAVKAAGFDPALFKRRFTSQLRIFAADANHFIRFYKLRKSIQKRFRSNR